MRRREIPGVGLTPLDALMGRSVPRMSQTEHARSLFGASHAVGGTRISGVGLTPLEALIGKNRQLKMLRARRPVSGQPSVRRPLMTSHEVEQTPRRQEGRFGHVVVIPTQNRSRLLEKCVGSIAVNMLKYGKRGKIRVIIVDDSTAANQRKNQHILERLAVTHHDSLEIKHYNAREQAQLVNGLKRETGVDVNKLIYSDPANRARHGYGGIRNLCLLVAARHAKPNDLVTFFDDDITLENLYLKKEKGNVVPSRGHLFNYFGKLDEIFSNERVKIISGRVTKDVLEPQNIIPRFLARARILAREASRHGESDLLGAVAKRLTRKDGLGKEISYERALRLMSVFSRDIFRRGALSIAVRYYDSNRPALTEIDNTRSLGGANVTIRASVLAKAVPYPTVDIRGEDTTWAMLMHRRLGGGLFYANLPVLHHKACTSGIFREYGQSVSFAPVYEVLKNIPSQSSHSSLAAQLKRSASLEKLTRGHRRAMDFVRAEFRRWDVDARAAMSVLSRKKAWWRERPVLDAAANRLHSSIAYFASDERDQILTHILPPERMQRSLHQYSELMTQWPRVLQAVRA